MSESEDRMIVGSEEWCGFPELGIPAVKARVDSGAKTSSMHAFNIQTIRRKGEVWVSFEVHPLQKNRKTVVRCEAPVVDRRTVKSSSGTTEKRYVIRTPVVVGGETWEIELTLANRDSMGYRMLLGREAMGSRILVDPYGSQCQGKVGKDDLRRLYGKAGKEQAGLKIGVLANNPELYSTRRILEAGEERGHDMMFLDIRHCFMKLDAAEPDVHYRGGRSLCDLDAVITRIRPSMTSYGCALARQFESMGISTINSSQATARARDKMLSLQMLLQHGLEIPATGLANSPVDTGELIDIVDGAPLIVKLQEGSQGKGVVLAETRKAAESVINTFKSLQANLLVQEFVKEAQGKDVRCLVLDGKVVASIEREAAPGEFRANIHHGGSASVVEITPEEKKIAIKAAKVLGLKVAGVDIIRSDKGPLLLDVNSSPGLEDVETATGKDIAGMLITSVEKKLGWKRELVKST